MTETVDLFWSFRSPYSYLATGRIVAMAQDWDMEVRVRPVYPLAVRRPDFFANANPLLVKYVAMDTRRVAEFHGIPYRWPRPDPVVMDMETLAIAEEQPHIHRLTHLGVEAARRDRGLPFIDEVSRLIWSGTVDGWDEGDHLAGAVARAGLDLSDMDKALFAPGADHPEEVAANQDALSAAGHWGVPTLVVDGEPFFGQDRLDMALWRLRQRGLKSRAADSGRR